MSEDSDSLARAEEAELAARRETLGQAADRVTSSLADADERAIESALRPKRLAEFTGQARVREQLSLILQSALRRGRPPDHLLLAAPLRDRFGFTAYLDFYAPDELEHIIRRSAGLLGVTLTDEGAAELSTRSRGTPRVAHRLLRG